MKIFFLIVLVLFSAYGFVAAEWDIIHTGLSTHYVSVSDSSIHSINIREEKQGNDGTEFFNYFMNEITTGTIDNPTCVIEKGDGWFGRKVLFADDGSQSFVNKSDENIKFLVNANAGDKWQMMKLKYGNYLEAEVSAIKYIRIFADLSDSVKIIILSEHNNAGEKVDSHLNELQFILSKHYGMVSMFNMYAFPDTAVIYVLKGIEGNGGLQPIKFKDVFDFDLGDEFHIYEGDTTIANRGILRLRRIKVIDKTYLGSENTFDYEVENEVMQIRFIAGDFDTVYNDNLVHLRYELNNYIDYLPEQSYLIKKLNDTNLTSNMFFVEQYGGRQVINPWRRYVRYIPPCFVKSNRNGEIYYSYIEGCGDFYEQDYYYGQKWRRLMYYKKGSQEWGKKLDFIVGVDDRKKDITFELKNNILSGGEPLQFWIPESGYYQLTISDVTGRTVKNSTVYFEEGLNELDLNGYLNGTYFVVFTKGVRSYRDKFNIIK
jgi:hypothetical protein